MSYAGIPISYSPAPITGTLDSGPLSPLPGGGVGAELPNFEGWFNQSGMTMNNGQPPTVLPGTQPAPGTVLGPADLGNFPNGIGGQGVIPGTNSTAAQVGQSLSSTVGFFTDPARIGTSLIGLVFIAGGIFLLGKGPAVNIIAKAGKDLAVGA